MLPMLAVIPLLVAPEITFTNDSVYKQENIIMFETQEVISEGEVVSYDLLLKERNLLGYMVYDNPDTEYIDGIRFDDEYVYNWAVRDFNPEAQHKILIKTVYTDDVAGMLVAAKDGDWSVALQNPILLAQLGYYVLATLALILTTILTLTMRKKKVKTMDEVTASIDTKATAASSALESKAIEIINGIITPSLTKLDGQNQSIIEALILSQSGDEASKLALINLLKSKASENVDVLANAMIKTVKEANEKKVKAKKEADEAVKQIASGDFKSDDDIGGIAI